MLQGLYTAASGMIAVEQRQDITASNVANAQTPGFKRQVPVQLGFYEVFSAQLRGHHYYDRESAPGGGVKNVESFPHMAGGAFAATGNPLNVAVEGSGFMSVDTPQGERFTRNGQFTIDMQGDLTTAEGNKIMSVGGVPIAVEGGAVVISEDGTVSSGGEVVGQIRLVEFEQPERLMREGDSLYVASEAVLQGQLPADNTRLSQQRLEMSNVSMPHEMISMVTGMRAYEANQRVIQAFDSTIQTLIQQVSSP